MQTPSRYDIFLTVQTYDRGGKCLYCPIYADFDGENSLEDVKKCYDIIRSRWGEPEVFYSGRKGFHLILDYPIHGNNCHHIVHTMMKMLGDFKTLDTRVYTERRLFRVVNTYNVEGERYKIKLSPSDIFNKSIDSIRDLAKHQCKYDKGIIYGLNLKSINRDYEKASDTARKIDTTRKPAVVSEYLPPCIDGILKGRPVDGTVNNSIFTICRALRSFDINQDKCMDMFMANDFYVHRQRTAGDVLPTIRSVYRKKEFIMPNCDEKNNADIMKPFCNDSCRYKIIDLWKSKNVFCS